MKFASALAIYFVIWWTVLFMVLPFGVRNAAESGEVVQQGNDRGAPIAHGLLKKMLITTIISAGVFAVLYWAMTHREMWLG